MLVVSGSCSWFNRQVDRRGPPLGLRRGPRVRAAAVAAVGRSVSLGCLRSLIRVGSESTLVIQFLFLVIAAVWACSRRWVRCWPATSCTRRCSWWRFFFTIACQFVLLEAEFLAAIQVLVYIGAVAILLMFGIMLTRNIQGDDTTILTGAWRMPALWSPGSASSASWCSGSTTRSAPAGQSDWSNRTCGPRSPPMPAEDTATAVRREAVNNMAKAVGDELMTRYASASRSPACC